MNVWFFDPVFQNKKQKTEQNKNSNQVYLTCVETAPGSKWEQTDADLYLRLTDPGSPGSAITHYTSSGVLVGVAIYAVLHWT
jgi:hypothetical protein